MDANKQPPERLALRAAPRPVTRLSRRALAAVLVTVVIAVFVATWWSLQPVRHMPDGRAPELHNTERLQRPDRLAELPADYSKVAPVDRPMSTPPPVLGPPLPGDLGAPILRAQEQGALSVVPQPSAAPAVDAVEEAARKARLAAEREREEAARSGLFFRSVAGRAAPAAVPDGISADNGRWDRDREAVAANVVANADTPAELQDSKLAFLNRRDAMTTRARGALEGPASPYQVMAGTVIPAALVTGIRSDLPGTIVAVVTEPVFDTPTGRHLLIPQGSRLIGEYDSQVAHGQRRVLLVWTRLMLPDASSIVLDRLPGVDVSGYAGLEDQVDGKWGRLFAGAALASIIGVGAELAQPTGRTEGTDLVGALRAALQDAVNDVGQQITRRNLDVQPALTIRAGFPVRVLVKRDLMLAPR